MKLRRSSPEELAKLGVVKVEAITDLSPLDEIREANEADLKDMGVKYAVSEVKVLSMPGVFIRAKSFSMFILRGKTKVFYVLSATSDKRSLAIVRSLQEGSPAKPGGAAAAAGAESEDVKDAMGRKDPFAGKKLKLDEGKDLKRGD